MLVQTEDDFMNIGTFDLDYKIKCIGAAIEGNQCYIIVICDMFDFEDYPVFAATYEEAMEKVDEYNKKSMQKVMGIYDITKRKKITFDKVRM